MKLKACREIRVLSFTRLETPKYIGAAQGQVVLAERPSEGLRRKDILPSDIRAKFKGDTNCVRAGGLVYSKYEGHLTLKRGIQEYTCSEDMTAEFKFLMAFFSTIEDYLESINILVGRELPTERLFYRIKDEALPLEFYDLASRDKGIGLTKIQLEACHSSGRLTFPRIVVPLAEMKYKVVK